MFRPFMLAGVVALGLGSAALAQDKKDPGAWVKESTAAVERKKLLKQYGGNDDSEAAVARGLAWIAREQFKDGSWKFDGSSTDQVAATSMALLPFLAAGESHNAECKYRKTVSAALDWLPKQQDRAMGSFKGASNMYSHASRRSRYATLAVSKDARLKDPATRAVNYIEGQGTGVGLPGRDGRRHVHPRLADPGPGAAAGWPDHVRQEGVSRGREVLVSVSVDGQSKYGYREKGQSQSLTPVALLSRYYIGWTPAEPGYTRGVDWLSTEIPAEQGPFDMYYYFYATQVLRNHEGRGLGEGLEPEDADMLVDMQIKRRTKPGSGAGTRTADLSARQCGRSGRPHWPSSPSRSTIGCRPGGQSST